MLENLINFTTTQEINNNYHNNPFSISNATQISLQMQREIQMGFLWCCKYNRIDTIKYIYKRSIPDYVTRNEGFKLSCFHGNIEIAQYLFFDEKERLGLGLEFDSSCIQSALIGTCKTGHLNVIKWLLSLIEFNYSIIQQMFIIVCTYGYLDIAEYITSLGYVHNDIQLFIDVCGTKNLEMVKFLKDMFKNLTWLDILCAYWSAIKSDQIHIANWLMEFYNQNQRYQINQNNTSNLISFDLN